MSDTEDGIPPPFVPGRYARDGDDVIEIADDQSVDESQEVDPYGDEHPAPWIVHLLQFFYLNHLHHHFESAGYMRFCGWYFFVNTERSHRAGHEIRRMLGQDRFRRSTTTHDGVVFVSFLQLGDYHVGVFFLPPRIQSRRRDPAGWEETTVPGTDIRWLETRTSGNGVPTGVPADDWEPLTQANFEGMLPTSERYAICMIDKQMLTELRPEAEHPSPRHEDSLHWLRQSLKTLIESILTCNHDGQPIPWWGHRNQ